MAEELERWEIFWRRLGWRVMFHGLELKEVINIRLGRKKQAGWLCFFLLLFWSDFLSFASSSYFGFYGIVIVV
jgi:hypothetical protein